MTEESEMPQVGAKFPMMLYRGGETTTVYDEEELKQAKKNGFAEHESMKEGQLDLGETGTGQTSSAPPSTEPPSPSPKPATPPPPDKGKK
jgi:hypothetical protein